MRKYLYFLMVGFTVISLSACDTILEPVSLKIENGQIATKVDQEKFSVKLKTLTLAEARRSNFDPYIREVLVSGSGKTANTYNEDKFLTDVLPPQNNPSDYLIGIGDELSFVRQENQMDSNNLKVTILNGANSSQNNNQNTIIQSQGRVGSDGSVLLLGLGNIQVLGEPLNNIREKVRNILVRNGMSPNFQLELTDFRSRKAYIFSSSIESEVMQLTNVPLSLKELAAKSSFMTPPNNINLIKLMRNGITYQLNFEKLVEENRPEIFIEDKDQIEFTSYPYKKSKVFTLTGAESADLIEIDPINRQSMADVLFIDNGPLEKSIAKRSEIYLLRGLKPIIAYHLDAQDVSRILVAEQMELRPKDIIFVAQRPIISFTRLLSEISPLRTLLNDINNGDILR
jgi:polysaccharide biosynthesis/export protein